jgi:hypothetical protein
VSLPAPASTGSSDPNRIRLPVVLSPPGPPSAAAPAAPVARDARVVLVPTTVRT